MKTVAAAFLLALAVAFLAAAPSHAAITCINVNLCIAPCVGYLTGQDAAPPAACCEGLRRLKALPTTTAERRFACDCVKQAAGRFPNLSNDAVKGLPAACAVTLPFPISLQFDCTIIQ